VEPPEPHPLLPKTCWSFNGLRPEHEDFLASAFPYDFRQFSPVLMTEYRRLTLVSADPPERITFDTGISFRHGRRTVSYPEFVIGEVKYEKGMKNSSAQAALRSMAIPRQGFSKYCIGISLLSGQVKHNRFKPKLLFLSRNFPGGDVPC
jgi:hypothetical protein